MLNLNNNSNTNSSKTILISKLQNNKYPIIITILFFLTSYYITFYHHHFWFEYDGIVFLNWGNDILNNNTENIFSSGAPLGGPFIFSIFNLVFNDGFLTIKLISLFTGAGCLFFSYYVIRNLFNSQVALIGQLLYASQASFLYQTILSEDTLLFPFLILVALYFITKNNFRLKYLILTALFLGLSFMVRYQSIFILIGIVIFLLVHTKEIKKNLKDISILIIIFGVVISPLLIFNYNFYDKFIDSSPSFYMLNSKYQTPDWHNKVSEIFVGTSNEQIVFLDPVLFLKNYFYNLFYNNTGNFFNFNSVDNSSIIPPIPFLGIIPVFGGLLYCMNLKINKSNFILLISSSSILTLLILFFGDITYHFFAILTIPIIILIFANVKQINSKILLLLIVSVTFLLLISFLPVSRIHMFSIWIIIPTLSAVFFVETIPKIFNKINKNNINSNKFLFKKYVLSIIVIVLLVNILFTFKVLEATLYNEPFIGIQNEISKFSNIDKHMWKENGIKYFEIGTMLSKQPDIKNSYVMANHNAYAYYADSKFLLTYFTEGLKNDTLNDFVTRVNWSDLELKISNVNTIPSGNPKLASYLIYEKPPGEIDRWGIIENPKNLMISDNFELLYYSNNTGIAVFKIHHQK